jgi:hypothetical protein
MSIDGRPKPLAQVKQWSAVGAAKVFKKTGSGTKTDGVQLRCALDQLAKGDVLRVTRSRRFRARQQLFTPRQRKMSAGFVRFEPPIGQNCFT